MREFPIHQSARLSSLIAGGSDQLLALAGTSVAYARHEVIRSQGSSDPAMYVLADGWALSSITLSDGERQIIRIYLPGDMLGSASACADIALDTLSACTACSVRKIPCETLAGAMLVSSRISAAVLFGAQAEQAVVMKHLTLIGRTEAKARLATFLVDLNTRLMPIGQSSNNAFSLPMSQEEVGDHLALTSVHVNRTLRRAEKEGLIHRKGSAISIPDLERLERAAAFLPQRLSSARHLT